MSFFRTRVGRTVMLTGAYLSMALAMSYPLVRHFGSYTLAGFEDGFMSLWNLWWVKYSLLNAGQSLLQGNFLIFPDGASLVFHSLPKFIGLVSIPFQYLTSITVTYNILFLLTFVFTALATYWLVYHLLGERIPAFLAGAFFAFCPYRWSHASHMQLLATMLIPVFVLLIIKGRESLEAGGWRPWGYFSLAGLALAVTAYDTEYYAIFLIIFSAIYLFIYLLFNLNKAALRKWVLLLAGLALAMVVSALLFLPVLLAALHEMGVNNNYVTFSLPAMKHYSAGILDFFLPQQTSHYLGSYFNTGNLVRSPADTVFLGWMALMLAIAGFWHYRHRREAWLWLSTALVFWALALGPYNKINSGFLSFLPGPYLVIAKLPVVSAARVPARFSVMTMFAVAILAGYGASVLFRMLKKKNWSRFAVPAAVALILLAIFVEYRPMPLLFSTATPTVYSEIAASDTPGSVITLPMGWEGGRVVTGLESTFVQLYQLEHERPLVGGMLARVPKQQLFDGVYTPVIDFLADPVNLEPSDLDRDPEAIARFQERYQVAFIVVHKTYPHVILTGSKPDYAPKILPEALPRINVYVTNYLDMEKFAETDEIVAYRKR